MTDNKGETTKLLPFYVTEHMKKIKKLHEKWYTKYPKLPSYFWPKFTIIWISSHRHRFHYKISLALWDQFLPTTSGGLFCSTQKMHISEYTCKICLKVLGILLKCRETFEKFIAVSKSSKNTGLTQFFFMGFWQLNFKNINILRKTKRCLIYVYWWGPGIYSFILLVYPIRPWSLNVKKHLTGLKIYLVIIYALELKVNS